MELRVVLEEGQDPHWSGVVGGTDKEGGQRGGPGTQCGTFGGLLPLLQ